MFLTRAERLFAGAGARGATSTRTGLRRALVASLAFLFALVLVVGPAAGPALAQGEGILSYEVQAEVLADGDMRVVETIFYNFGGASERGILRDIPDRASFDDEQWRITEVDDILVSMATADGAEAPRNADDTDVSSADNNTRIRIGNENVFLDGGVYRYDISYIYRDTVQAVERNDEQWEEIAWNAIGTGWTVPVDDVSVTVKTPAAPLRFTCFKGASGSTEHCNGTGSGPNSVTFVARELAPREGVTVAVAMPTGTVSDTELNLKYKWTLARAFSVNPLTLIGFAAASVFGIGGVLSLLSRHGRDQRTALSAYLPSEHGGSDDVDLVGPFEKADGVVRYNPPDNTTPGLVGVIIDESADPLDISATIVDLAVRGYLRIEELGKDDFVLRMLAEPTEDLLDYERLLLAELWKHIPNAAQPTVALSTLNTHFASSLGLIQARLYGETMQRGWFTRHPERVRKAWLAAGIFAFIVAAAMTVGLAAVTTWALVGLPLILAGALLAALHGRMPSRTATGRAILEQSVGYEKFLDVADADQLKFQELQNEFVAALPYAMVFGLTERWAEVLSVLQDGGFDVEPNWYVGNWGGGGFHYYHLAYSLNSFTHRAHSTMTAPPPAPVNTNSGGGFSGGSFGGGFSGGGFGGGGGGSW